ncbi:substrate-binding periplasmic protein [Conexibacter arvalis]|uniref:Polar amino acid transport system substrate-binding protein n=1 Tax=Conexibacter arvalis TaxID=912552 RepID=A0A840IB61_9ACTN|nr:transporter substrate-binding domain-containing protein [Conexibacter arvalis]MBB4661344.1 polar amino acid transport system substrate-binding protein [Conexibacter arvalis]
MLLAGAGVLAAGAVTGCGLTKSEDSSASSGAAAAGESALARIKKDKKVRFGVDLSFAPLQYRDPRSKEPTGYSIEVSKLLAAALGAEAEWVEVPFQELISAQKAGRFDMVGIPVVNTAERALEVAFAAAPAFLEGTYLFQRRGLGLSRIEQLNDGSKTIALLAGSAQVNTAKLLFPKAKRKELPDDVAATADVSTGRSDALFVGDYAIGDARRKGLELIQPRPVATAWNTYFLPQGDIILQQFVTTFLQQKASDLTLANLWQQFVASDIERYGVQSAPVKDPYLAAAYA